MRRNILRDINKLVCEVRRSENCSFISIFTLILKPLLAQITSLFSEKYLCSKFSSQDHFLIAKTGTNELIQTE